MREGEVFNFCTRREIFEGRLDVSRGASLGGKYMHRVVYLRETFEFSKFLIGMPILFWDFFR